MASRPLGQRPADEQAEAAAARDSLEQGDLASATLLLVSCLTSTSRGQRGTPMRLKRQRTVIGCRACYLLWQKNDDDSARHYAAFEWLAATIVRWRNAVPSRPESVKWRWPVLRLRGFAATLVTVSGVELP